MALMALADNVRETTTSTGASGTLSLGGASSSSVRTFVNGVGNGKVVPHKIDDGAGNWENRWGTVVSGTPDTITYGSFISSSTGSPVTFGAGSKTVSIVPMYELFITPAPSPALVETDIASATTTDLGTVTTLRARVTGTITITGFGSATNSWRIVRFASTLVLTHNATSLILLGGTNRQTAADDVGIYISDASGYWREISYQRAAGVLSTTFTNGSILAASYTQMASLTLTPGRWRVTAGAVAIGAPGSAWFSLAISTTTASASGTTTGKDFIYIAIASASGVGGGALSAFEITVTSNTAYYLNSKSAADAASALSGVFRADPII